jgi:F-type H+-transporting ATPase subunit epsilon
VDKLKIEVLSPDGVIFNGEVISVSLPTFNGVITILPGHVNLITKLDSGEIIIESIKNKKKISISGGFVEIVQNNITVIAEFAIQSSETNKQKINQAIELANSMKNKRQKFVNMSIIESQLRSVCKLKLELNVKRKKI